MIHTFTMYANLKIENIAFCEEKYNTNYILVSDKFNINGLTATIANMYGNWKLFLTIDVIKLFNRGDIMVDDCIITESFLDAFCMDNFGELLDLILTRLEYRYDARVSSSERVFLLGRYKKIIDKRYFSKKNTYENTVYHSNKSKSRIVYDKEKEREAKGCTIESYEKDMLRYEVKHLSRHLYYNKREHGIERSLKCYWTYDNYKSYFSNEFKPIIYPGNYYKMYSILKILKKLNIKDKDIEQIRELLTIISRSGVSAAKNNFTNYMFNKHLDTLAALNINPIIIQKNYKKILNNDNCFENPLNTFFN